MCADERVMKHFSKLLSREECNAGIRRNEAHFDKHGFGFWAVEIIQVTPFIGFVGLRDVDYQTPFTPAVEIAWRLAAEHWNQGYATEAARAALKFGFESVTLAEIVSFTVPGNVPSRRVMEKLGMVRDLSGDFDHPLVPEGHPLRRHVLYRIRAK
jgi:ribosomal-protein-alanine N-acetyltransferase